MPKMLNGIEVPTRGRIVEVRRGYHGNVETLVAIVVSPGDLSPDLFVLPTRPADEGGAVALTVPHESAPLIGFDTTWRWPPREEQPAKAPRIAPSCHLCPHTAHVGMICAEAVDWHEQCGCSVPGVTAPAVAATIAAEEQAERRELRAVIAKLRADVDAFVVAQDKLIAERDAAIAEVAGQRHATNVVGSVLEQERNEAQAHARYAFEWGMPLVPASCEGDRAMMRAAWDEKKKIVLTYPRRGG